MNGNSTSPPGAPGSGRHRGLRLALVTLLLLLLAAMLLVPVAPGERVAASAGCPALYQRLGKLLSSLPRDSGRKAAVRYW